MSIELIPFQNPSICLTDYRVKDFSEIPFFSSTMTYDIIKFRKFSGVMVQFTIMLRLSYHPVNFSHVLAILYGITKGYFKHMSRSRTEFPIDFRNCFVYIHNYVTTT